MTGTGAMEGALDVALYITKSEAGARRLRVEFEARDFATADPLGVALTGEGTGKHGGLTYTDAAEFVVDPTAAEERDLAAELEQLLADGKWRTIGEAAGKSEGIGAREQDVREALAGAPDRFATVDGKRAGRHPSARPWGTRTMLAALDPEGAPAAGSTPEHLADSSATAQLRAGAPPVGGGAPEHLLGDGTAGTPDDGITSANSTAGGSE